MDNSKKPDNATNYFGALLFAIGVFGAFYSPAGRIIFIPMGIIGLIVLIVTSNQRKEYERKDAEYKKSIALTCPNCKKPSAINISILEIDNCAIDEEKTKSHTSYSTTGRGWSQTKTTHSVVATVEEICKFCSYKSSEFSISATNVHYNNSDSEPSDYGGTITSNSTSGILGYPNDEDIKKNWLNQKLNHY